MKSWAQLPTEILNKIFITLYIKDTSQCSKVCRTWRTPAQTAMFRTIQQIDEEKMTDLIATLSIYRNNKESNSPGNFVKCLDCEELGDGFDVELLDKAFPFVQYVIINTKKQLFSRKLYQAIAKGSFPYLKEIPWTDFNRSYMKLSYMKLALARKNRIEELILSRTAISASNFEKVIQNLHNFSSLETLSLNIYENTTPLCLESLLLYNPPRLKLFRLKCLSGEDICVNVDIDSVQPFPTVRHVKIESSQILSGGDKSYLYLMKKFPNVITLLASHTPTDIYQIPTYRSPTEACLFQFLVYQFNIKKRTHVGPMLTNDFTSTIVEKFFKYVLEQRTSSDDIELALTIVLDEVEPQEDHIHSLRRNAYVELENLQNEEERSCSLTVVYKVEHGSTFQKHLDLYEKVKDMGITTLTITDSRLRSGRVAVTPVVLDDVFDQFTNLKELEVHNIQNLICINQEQNQQQPISAIESLEFMSCILTEENFTGLSSRFPVLESLTFWDCVYNDTSINPDLQVRRFLLNMPATRIEELTIIKTQLLDQHSAFFRCLTNGKKPRYCKVDASGFTDECTDVDYGLCLEDGYCVVYDIYCDAVTELIVQVHINTNDDEEERIYDRSYLEESS